MVDNYEYCKSLLEKKYKLGKITREELFQRLKKLRENMQRKEYLRQQDLYKEASIRG